jgi:hypothetical protein
VVFILGMLLSFSFLLSSVVSMLGFRYQTRELMSLFKRRLWNLSTETELSSGIAEVVFEFFIGYAVSGILIRNSLLDILVRLRMIEIWCSTKLYGPFRQPGPCFPVN